MEGVAVVRVIRQVQIIRVVGINRPNETPSVAQSQQQPQLPPTPEKNKRCINAFVLLVIYFVGIGSIVIGALYLNDCPAQKMLPGGLIILGGMIIVARLLNCVYDCRSIRDEETTEDTPPCLVLLNLLFILAEFGMFIAVCYYAFSISPTTNPADRDLKNYCHYNLYKTSFVGCIIGIIFYGLPFLCACGIACTVCCTACAKSS